MLNVPRSSRLTEPACAQPSVVHHCWPVLPLRGKALPQHSARPPPLSLRRASTRGSGLPECRVPVGRGCPPLLGRLPHTLGRISGQQVSRMGGDQEDAAPTRPHPGSREHRCRAGRRHDRLRPHRSASTARLPPPGRRSTWLPGWRPRATRSFTTPRSGTRTAVATPDSARRATAAAEPRFARPRRGQVVAGAVGPRAALPAVGAAGGAKTGEPATPTVADPRWRSVCPTGDS